MSNKRKFTGPQRSIMKKARSDPYYSSAAAMRGARNVTARRLAQAGFFRPEIKYYDTSLVASALTAPNDATGGEKDPATVLTISAPAQGDGEQNRDGNRIVVKSAYVTGTIVAASQQNQTAADNAAKVFIALVQDTQSNGSQLNSEDVYTNPSANGGTATSLLRNLQYSSRFRVLATYECVLSSPTMSYDGTNIEQSALKHSFKLSWKGSMPVQFKGGATAAGISGVSDNSLHVIAFTDQTELVPAISYNARVRFQG